MITFTFEHPQYLFLLVLLPLMVFIHFYSLGNKKKTALKFANFDAIARIRGVDFFSKNLVILFLNSFAILFLVLAASGLNLHTMAQSSSFSYVLAIDNSDSMSANDFSPNRLESAKKAALNFIDVLPRGVKAGVVSFSGNAYIEKDLVEDKLQLRNAINGITLEGFGGTDLYETVITSTNLLKGQEHRAIILLSDGQINVGELEDIIQYARDNDVIVHSIGIGTEEGGETDYAYSKLDEESLKSISYNTNGNYTRVRDDRILSDVYSNFLSLTEKRISIDLTLYLVLIVIFLIVIWFFLSNTKYFNLI